jgi:hypothetical protein
MADKVQIGWNYSVSKDSKSEKDTDSFSYTPASHLKGAFTQAILTTLTVITFGNAASIASFTARNTDSSNYVELFTDAGGTTPFSRLAAGESLPPLRVKAGVPYWGKANTATCYVEFNYDGAS